MKRVLTTVLVLLAVACDDANTSGVSADYATLRVRELVLTDAAGKPAVTVSAERRPSGAPALLVRGPNGSVLRTIELDAKP